MSISLTYKSEYFHLSNKWVSFGLSDISSFIAKHWIRGLEVLVGLGIAVWAVATYVSGIESRFTQTAEDLSGIKASIERLTTTIDEFIVTQNEFHHRVDLALFKANLNHDSLFLNAPFQAAVVFTRDNRKFANENNGQTTRAHSAFLYVKPGEPTATLYQRVNYSTNYDLDVKSTGALISETDAMSSTFAEIGVKFQTGGDTTWAIHSVVDAENSKIIYGNEMAFMDEIKGLGWIPVKTLPVSSDFKNVGELLAFFETVP